MDIIEKGYIRIEDGKITALGNIDDSFFIPDGIEAIDATGKIIIPGFVNTHTHIPMNMLRGYADDLPLHKWLTEYIFPAEAALITPENIRAVVRLAFLEMIESGTTCFNDMYFFEDVIAEEAKKVGLRAVLNDSLIDFPTPSFSTVEEGLIKMENLIKKWQGDEIIHPSVCIHSPYTCSKETLLQAKRLADKYETVLHIHLSETLQEVQNIKDETGLSPVEYIYHLGILDKNTVAAHCVWLGAKDIDIFALSEAGICHCPKSNLKLGSGIADIATYREKGIKVGIGTDGVASNNTMDMIEEMRFAALLPKGIHQNPEFIPTQEALKMATALGVEILGLGEITGTIEEGKRADLVFIEKDYNILPIYNEYSALMYAMNKTNIHSVMVNGEWLMKDHIVKGIDKKEEIEKLDRVIAKFRVK